MVYGSATQLSPLTCYIYKYTGGQYVLVDRPFYPQEKWACDFHDDATPLSFQLQITGDYF